MKEIEVWIVVDEAGDFSVRDDRDAAIESFGEDYGSTGARRVVKVKVKVPLPRDMECEATVPEETGVATATAK